MKLLQKSFYYLSSWLPVNVPQSLSHSNNLFQIEFEKGLTQLLGAGRNRKPIDLLLHDPVGLLSVPWYYVAFVKRVSSIK